MLAIPLLSEKGTFWSILKTSLLDDSIDRLNYSITTGILLFFALLVASKQHFGSPIQCMVPAEFPAGWDQYVNSYCFVQNTYMLPDDQLVPDDMNERGEAELGYYQWVPFVFLFQAVMFAVPNTIWKVLQRQSHLNFDAVISEAIKIRALSGSERKQRLQELSEFVFASIRSGQRQPSLLTKLFFKGRYGSYSIVVYIITKALYVGNIVLQFFFFNYLIGTNYNNFWGIKLLNDINMGEEWAVSTLFPRVTLCDIEQRHFGDITRYTVQCVLAINMLNEKLFVFIWFWFAFVGICSTLSLVYYLVMFVPSPIRVSSALFYIDDEEINRQRFHQYVANTLRADGVLLLKLVDSHAGGVVAHGLATNLWHNYLVDI